MGFGWSAGGVSRCACIDLPLECLLNRRLTEWAVPHLGKQYTENYVWHMINNHSSVIVILIYVGSGYTVGKQEARGQV